MLLRCGMGKQIERARGLRWQVPQAMDIYTNRVDGRHQPEQHSSLGGEPRRSTPLDGRSCRGPAVVAGRPLLTASDSGGGRDARRIRVDVGVHVLLLEDQRRRERLGHLRLLAILGGRRRVARRRRQAGAGRAVALRLVELSVAETPLVRVAPTTPYRRRRPARSRAACGVHARRRAEDRRPPVSRPCRRAASAGRRRWWPWRSASSRAPPHRRLGWRRRRRRET